MLFHCELLGLTTTFTSTHDARATGTRHAGDSMKQYDKNGLAGCVQQTRTRYTGILVSLYNTAQADMDEGAGPWVTVCEKHSRILGHESLAVAKDFASCPQDWCETCGLEN